MQLKWIDGNFSVCRLYEAPATPLPGSFAFYAKTDNELSLVCQTECVPESVQKREDGWCMFRIEGQLDFALTGILAGISSILANEKIGIFAVSTYDTDYILIKEEQAQAAQSVLQQHSYLFME
ncbi:ACT domain-containing protein [Christensenellaceae bacterium OttesenSCG-928-K19]|nr:ACT domain-containing protein [Christensenellaceae bacterium OttesenSCG-928-K19]